MPKYKMARTAAEKAKAILPPKSEPAAKLGTGLAGRAATQIGNRLAELAVGVIAD